MQQVRAHKSSHAYVTSYSVLAWRRTSLYLRARGATTKNLSTKRIRMECAVPYVSPTHTRPCDRAIFTSTFSRQSSQGEREFNRRGIKGKARGRVLCKCDLKLSPYSGALFPIILRGAHATLMYAALSCRTPARPPNIIYTYIAGDRSRRGTFIRGRMDQIKLSTYTLHSRSLVINDLFFFSISRFKLRRKLRECV